jgi:hypothetical protein
MRNLLFLIFTAVFSSASHAYFIAVPKDQGPIDYTKVSHILIPGRGAELGLQPQETALGRALLYKRNFPDEQVVMISVFRDISEPLVKISAEQHEAMLLKGGWIILERHEKEKDRDTSKDTEEQKAKYTLNTTSVMTELLKFEKIRSLEFFGHNSASRGTQTDGLDHSNPDRFDPRKEIVWTLKSHFTADAYAIIHGCNSGWLAAQNLSEKWGIAVAGSLTETHFERLYSDGHYYVDTASYTPDPTNPQWATHNPDLGGVDCEYGGCKRMRPEVKRYVGSWGDFDGPLLSHFKFFCRTETKDCEKRMALSLYSFVAEHSLTPDSTYEEFREVAKQFLCPLTADRAVTNDCYTQLDKIEQGTGNMQISYVEKNKQLVCDLISCKAKIVCDDDKHFCKLSDRVSKNSETLAREYLHLLNGYKALAAGK